MCFIFLLFKIQMEMEMQYIGNHTHFLKTKFHHFGGGDIGGCLRNRGLELRNI
jgi:hypothetical protein